MKTITKVVALSIFFIFSVLSSCEGPKGGKKDDSANEPSKAEKQQGEKHLQRMRADSTGTYNNK